MFKIWREQILWVILAGLLFNPTPVTAQTNGFRQRGEATQLFRPEGLCIAHSSLPLNSKVKLVNTSTGKEIEVTVIRRIPAASNRIADVSSDVWKKLELTSGVDVIIYTNASAKSRPAIFVNGLRNYDFVPGRYGSNREFMSLLVAIILESREAGQPDANATTTADADNDKIYRLRVASSPTPEAAAKIIRLLEGCSFNVVTESDGSLYRVTVSIFPRQLAIIRPGEKYDFIPNEYSSSHEFMLSLVAMIMEAGGAGLPDADNGKISRLQVGAFPRPEFTARTNRQTEDSLFNVVTESDGSAYKVTVTILTRRWSIMWRGD